MKKIVFIFLCVLTFVMPKSLYGESSYKRPLRPRSYYLINPEMPYPLNITLCNDSIMHLWITEPKMIGLSENEADEWIEYDSKYPSLFLKKNVSNQHSPSRKIDSKKSKLLYLWTGINDIKDYEIKRAYIYVFFVKGYPMIEVELGNPYSRRQENGRIPGESAFESIDTEMILSILYPERFLVFFSSFPWNRQTRKNKKTSIEEEFCDTYIYMNNDVMRVEYQFKEHYYPIIEKYSIDLFSDLDVKNPDIRIGKLLYSTRRDSRKEMDGASYSWFNKTFPILEGRRLQILSLIDTVPFSNAYVDNMWFIRKPTQLEKKVRTKIDIINPFDNKKNIFITESGDTIALNDFPVPSNTKGMIFRGDSKWFDYYEKPE